LFDPNLLPYTILNLLIVERFTVFRSSSCFSYFSYILVAIHTNI
jgi:hypothetical protein